MVFGAQLVPPDGEAPTEAALLFFFWQRSLFSIPWPLAIGIAIPRAFLWAVFEVCLGFSLIGFDLIMH